MTLDEAIKHCEEVMMENLEKTKDRNASDPIAINCFECADEHRQLAEWLKELKAYREHSGDAISRQAAIVQLSHNKNGDDDCDVIIQNDIETIKALPPATPQPATPQQKVGRCKDCKWWKKSQRSL